MDKFNAVIEYLETLPDNEIAMFVYGFDSIVKKDLYYVEKVFKSMIVLLILVIFCVIRLIVNRF